MGRCDMVEMKLGELGQDKNRMEDNNDGCADFDYLSRPLDYLLRLMKCFLTFNSHYS